MVTATSYGPLEQDDIDQLLEAVQRYVPAAHWKETNFGQELRIVIVADEHGTYTPWTYG